MEAGGFYKPEGDALDGNFSVGGRQSVVAVVTRTTISSDGEIDTEYDLSSDIFGAINAGVPPERYSNLTEEQVDEIVAEYISKIQEEVLGQNLPYSLSLAQIETRLAHETYLLEEALERANSDPDIDPDGYGPPVDDGGHNFDTNYETKSVSVQSDYNPGDDQAWEPTGDVTVTTTTYDTGTVTTTVVDELGSGTHTITDKSGNETTYTKSGYTADIPIIIDLDGDGVEINFNANVSFDMDGDGFREQTSWAGANDGFLVIDLDANGKLTGGDGKINFSKELVFSEWREGAETDLQALRRHFKTGDVLDVNDEIWEHLRIWQDENQNGEVDDGELRRLDSNKHQITKINMTYDDETGYGDKSNDITVFGNTVYGLASYEKLNGDIVTGGVGDVSLRYNKMGWKEVQTAHGYSIVFESGEKLQYGKAKQVSDGHIDLQALVLDGAIGDERGNRLDASGHTRVVQISGAEGDDTIIGGNNDDTLSGDQGADRIDGNGGNDVIFADAADLAVSGAVKGGSGMDTLYVVDYAGEDIEPSDVPGVYIDLEGMGFEAVVAGRGDDTVDGRGMFDDLSVSGGTGHDQITGGVGNDALNGNDGADTVKGGSGDDIVSGGDGDDVLNGESGDDMLFGDDGADALTGANGDDLLLGGDGTDTLRGGNHDDVLDGGQGNDQLDGGNGDDVLRGGGGADTLQFWKGDDTLDGGLGDDVFVLTDAGGAYGDAPMFGWSVLYGGKGTDTLVVDFARSDVSLKRVGGEESQQWQLVYLKAPNEKVVIDLIDIERIQFNGDTSSLDVGELADLHDLGGVDGSTETADNYVRQSPNWSMGDGGITADGSNTFFLNGTNTYYPDANLSGWTGHDMLVGHWGSDIIIGGSGSDLLSGEAGDDDIKGSEGSDRIFGGDGNDSIQAGGGADIAGGGTGDDLIEGRSGADRLDGDAGADILRGESGSDTLSGGDGNDLAEGGEGHDAVYGGAGDDTLKGWTGADTLGGGDGNDSIEGEYGADELGGGYGNDTLLGGDGFDLLYGGAGDDDLDGGEDDDWLFGGDGADTLKGGSGRDVLEGGAGADVIDGGEDRLDVASYLNSDAAVRIDLTDKIFEGGNATGDTLTGIENVSGSEHDDTLIGNSKDNMLEGGDGKDNLTGHAGHDSFHGGAGDDTISGGDGNDRVWGGDGNDVITLGAGNDAFYDNDEDDELGADWVDGESGDDELYGGGGDDTLIGGTGDDTIIGGINHDRLIGNDGDDLVKGGYGDDSVSGGVGTDTLTGGVGNDTLDGGHGNDKISGGEGSDRFVLSNGNDTITDFEDKADKLVIEDGPLEITVAETGNDVLLTWAGGSLLLENTARADISKKDFVGDVTLIGTSALINGRSKSEEIEGYGTNDTINGHGGNDTLIGGDGHDSLISGSGADRLEGGNHNDTLIAGAGNDTLYGGADQDLLYGGDHNDLLEGGAGNDTLYGGTGADDLYGGSNNDYLLGGSGADHMDGGSGTDRVQYDQATSAVLADLQYAGRNTGEAAGDTYVSIENLYGSNHSDNLRGDAGNNVIWGANGQDQIHGRDGNDTLYGGVHNDKLYGGDGNDRLDGGVNNDMLYGGNGNDTLLGGSGNDFLRGSGGADSIDGGAGIDRVNYANSGAAVHIDLSRSVQTGGHAQGDTLKGIEWVEASNYNDSVVGNGSNNYLLGFDGSDIIRGRNGNDTLAGHTGDDNLTGGSGADVFHFYGNLNNGYDRITDFAVNSDHIKIAGGYKYNDLEIKGRSDGAVIEWAKGKIKLEGVSKSDLDAGDFVF